LKTKILGKYKAGVSPHGRSGMGSTSASAKVNNTGNTVDHVLKTTGVQFLR